MPSDKQIAAAIEVGEMADDTLAHHPGRFPQLPHQCSVIGCGFKSGARNHVYSEFGMSRSVGVGGACKRVVRNKSFPDPSARNGLTCDSHVRMLRACRR